MSNKDEFISEFLDSDTIDALKKLLESNTSYEESVDKIALAFGAKKDFSKMDNDSVNKLVVSFKNNLTLLIQKTWVEKSDIALKDQLLYKLGQLLSNDDSKWAENYNLFREIIDQAVYLMFGQSTNSPDFAEYSIRIDPEFGIFWWYISSLPQKTDWSEEKLKLAMMLGMFFLANY